MDITDLTTLLGNYAFPIVCVFGMFLMWNKERQDHKDEMSEVTKAVQNNNTLLEKILTKLEDH